MRRPLESANAVEWRKYAESLEDRIREHQLTSFRLSRIERALGIEDGTTPETRRESHATWGRADLPPSA